MGHRKPYLALTPDIGQLFARNHATISLLDQYKFSIEEYMGGEK